VLSIEFLQGDMTALDFPNHAFAGAVAFYSILHLNPPEISTAFRENASRLEAFWIDPHFVSHW
jgi:hypothetical protein